jgi:hypothetical protein
MIDDGNSIVAMLHQGFVGPRQNDRSSSQRILQFTRVVAAGLTTSFGENTTAAHSFLAAPARLRQTRD